MSNYLKRKFPSLGSLGVSKAEGIMELCGKKNGDVIIEAVYGGTTQHPPHLFTGLIFKTMGYLRQLSVSLGL